VLAKNIHRRHVFFRLVIHGVPVLGSKIGSYSRLPTIILSSRNCLSRIRWLTAFWRKKMAVKTREDCFRYGNCGEYYYWRLLESLKISKKSPFKSGRKSALFFISSTPLKTLPAEYQLYPFPCSSFFSCLFFASPTICACARHRRRRAWRLRLCAKRTIVPRR